jgi:UDP-2,3-diacylglucosamine pyrophosphatase LpxH
MGALQIVNKVVLELPDGKKAWVFHGDVFDVTMQHSKWLAKLGAVGYDALIVINKFFNFISERILKKGKLSLAQKIKSSVKSAVSFVNDFEQTASDIGISNKFDFVVCGHIHHPEIRTIKNNDGEITYLNSGDWVENLSALEYSAGEWCIYKFNESDKEEMNRVKEEEGDEEFNNSKLFANMLVEFNLMKQ